MLAMYCSIVINRKTNIGILYKIRRGDFFGIVYICIDSAGYQADDIAVVLELLHFATSARLNSERV